jgi:glycosyl transferase family 25
MAQLTSFLLNLDRSPDRLQRMQEQATKIGIELERVPAIDGLALPEGMRREFLASGVPRGGMLPGEVGCYASHLLAYERVISEQLPYAVVLEDDPELRPGLMEVATAAAQACPAGWHVIHLWHNSKHSNERVAPLPDWHWLVRPRRLPINAAGYIISQAGAQLLRTPGPRARPIDMVMRYGHLHGIKSIYAVTPPVIVPALITAATTTIDPTGARDRYARGRWRPTLLEQLTVRARRLLPRSA